MATEEFTEEAIQNIMKVMPSTGQNNPLILAKNVNTPDRL